MTPTERAYWAGRSDATDAGLRLQQETERTLHCVPRGPVPDPLVSVAVLIAIQVKGRIAEAGEVVSIERSLASLLLSLGKVELIR